MSAPTPLDYALWRRTRLGAITEALEARSVLAAAGEVSGLLVLDVGCGAGAYAVALARRGATVLGIDVSVPALLAARVQAQEANAQVGLAAADAACLPVRDDSVDLVFAVTALTFTASPERAVREAARVLRPGGRLVVGELGAWSTWSAWRRVRSWVAPGVWHGRRFWTVARLRELVSVAGLVPGSARGAVYFPPLGAAARALAPFDHLCAHLTTLGAGFLVVDATRPPRGA